jgi:hypothetical protein
MFIQSATTAGTFQTPLGLSTDGANWVAVGDLNHDGTPDIAVTDAFGVRVFFHTGSAASVAYSAPAVIFVQTFNFNVPAGSLIVAVLYLGLNMIFIYSTPLENLKGVIAVGTLSASNLFGANIAGLFSALIGARNFFTNPTRWLRMVLACSTPRNRTATS